MRKGRFSEEQIINVPKEHQAGIPVVELCRKHGISSPRSTSAASDAVLETEHLGLVVSPSRSRDTGESSAT